MTTTKTPRKPTSILAWHFVGTSLRDETPIPPDGETLIYKGEIEPCARGLHASVRVIDALQYAPGGTICRVRCGGDIIHQDDKLVCSMRTILWRIENSDDLLRTFARSAALSVIDLWDAPPIVRQYLETGDEAIRAAAARAAASAAARDAARDAAWAAASAAARDAARAAASAAARDAARAAARDAARVAKFAARAAKFADFNAELERLVFAAAGQTANFSEGK